MGKVISNPLLWLMGIGVVFLSGCGDSDGDKVSPPPALQETRCPYGVGTEMTEPVMVDGVEHLGCELKGRYAYEDLTVQPGYAKLNKEFNGKPVVYVLDGVVELGSSETYNSVRELNDIKLAEFHFQGVKFRAREGAVLVVHRNGKLVTDAYTQFASIDDNFEGLGEWGGIVVYGFARNSRCPESDAESGVCNIAGDFGNYGGFLDAEEIDSPLLTSAPIGLVAEAGGQVGGKTVAAVSLHSLVGTNLFQPLEIVNSGGDGIYIDGGDVKLKAVVIDNSAAHAIHWVGGYRGVIQQALVQHSSDNAAIKAESDSEAFFSAPAVSNLTLNNPQAELGDKSGTAFEFSGITGAFINNSVATGFSNCVDVTSVSNDTRLIGGEWVFTDVILHCDKLLRINEGTAAIGEGLLQISRIVEKDPELGFFGEVTSETFPYETIQLSDRAGVVIGKNLFDANLNFYGAIKDGTNASIWYENFVFDYSRREPECSGIGTLLAEAVTVEGKKVSACRLNNTINQNVTLKEKVNNEEVVWLLDGIVRFGQAGAKTSTEADVTAIVNAGSQLRIRSGVRLVAKSGAALVIERGSSLHVEGQQTKPVIFSSEDDNFVGTGEWGGVIINGFALNNQCGEVAVCNAGDNVTGFHGGNLADSGSASISYLRILEAGGDVNGQGVAALTLNSVGGGTGIQYLEVSGSKTVALNLRGGAANFKNLLLTDNQGENLRWSLGYQGTLQQGFVQSPEEGGGSAISGFNAEGDAQHDAQPRSKPAIANFTFIGNGNENTTAIRFQKGSGGYLYNSVVTQFGRCLNVDDESTFDLIGANPAELYFGNVALDCNQTLVEVAADASDRELEGIDYGQSLLVPERVFQVAVELDSNYIPSGELPELYDLIDVTLLSVEQQASIDTSHNYFGALSDVEDRWYLVWSDALGSLLSDECNQMGTLTDLEIPTGNSNPVNARVCSLKGTITAERRLVPVIDETPVIWLLSGNVRVGVGDKQFRDQTVADEVANNKVTLYIEPGTFIMAANENSGLHISRGGRIVAEGSDHNENAIYFMGWTSSLGQFYSIDDKLEPHRLEANDFGQWIGLQIDGFARNNLCSEADTASMGVCNQGDPANGFHGGYNNADDSGILKNVRFYNAQRLWFNSVGRGTDVSRITFLKDDRVEPEGGDVTNLKIPIVRFNGGVVNASHLFVATTFHNILQWNYGYQGTLQHLNFVQFADYSGNISDNQPAIIGLNTAEDDDQNIEAEPRSMPTLVNMSLAADSLEKDLSPPAIRLSQGSGLFLLNSIVGTAFSGSFLNYCLDVDGDVGADLAESNRIVFSQVVMGCENYFASEDNIDQRISDAMTREGSPNAFFSVKGGMEIIEVNSKDYLYGYLKTLKNITDLATDPLNIDELEIVDKEAIQKDVRYLGNDPYRAE